MKNFVNVILALLCVCSCAHCVSVAAGNIYINLSYSGDDFITPGGFKVIRATVDSIVTRSGSHLPRTEYCLNEYQAFRLKPIDVSYAIADIVFPDSAICTGSSCYRDVYSHSPFDVDRELLANACYYLASDSGDFLNVGDNSSYNFIVRGFRVGTLEISLTEEFVSDTFAIWRVVSDTILLRIGGGSPIDCPPLRTPECLGARNITPLSADGLWHHVIFARGYEYAYGYSSVPPSSGTFIDTNFVNMEPLVPARRYFLHSRARFQCESGTYIYSDWSSISFDTPRHPEVTIRTNPQNLRFIVDGDEYVSENTFSWPYSLSGGSAHFLEAITPQLGVRRPIFKFKTWSDGGAASHVYVSGSSDAVITCNFDSLDASFVVQTSPVSPICASSPVNVSVTFNNCGSLKLKRTDRIYLYKRSTSSWGVDSVQLPLDSINVGANAVFNFTVTSPAASGEHVFCWQLKQIGVGFFGGISDSVRITVLPKPNAIASNTGPYCEGAEVFLRAQPDGLRSYRWILPGHRESFLQNPNLGPAEISFSGVCTLVVSNDEGCLDTALTTLTVNAKPRATIGGILTVCEGDSIKFTGSPSSMTYNWTGVGGFSSTLQNPFIANANFSHAGEYRLIVRSSAGCVDTATCVVVVRDKPEVEAHCGTPICSGGAADLYFDTPGLSSYKWISPRGEIFFGEALHFGISDSTMNGSWVAIGTTIDGCCDTAVVELEVRDILRNLRIVSLSADSIFLHSGSSTNLHCVVEGACGDVGITWSNAALLDDAHIFNPRATLTDTTTFEVVVRDSQECGVYEVRGRITIYVVPIFACHLRIDEVSRDTTVCSGSSFDLHVSVDSGYGLVDYTWTPSTYLSAVDIAEPTCTPFGNISYTVVVVDDSGCVDFASVTVRSDDYETHLLADRDHICAGERIWFTGEVIGGIAPYSYEWSPPALLDTIDGLRASGVFLRDAKVNLRVIDAAGCIHEDSLFIDVDSSLASMTILPVAEETCIYIGSSTRLHANLSGGIGGIGYTWEPSSALDLPHSPNPWANPVTSGWFVLTATDTQGICVYTLRDSVFIRVMDTTTCPMNVTILCDDTIICAGDEIHLRANVTDFPVPELSFAWSPESLVDSAHSQNTAARVLESTNFSVIVRSGDCEDTATVFVRTETVDTTLELRYVWAERETIDFGDTTNLHVIASGFSGALHYDWTPRAYLSPSDSDVVQAFPNHTTNFRVIVSDSQICGTVAETAYVRVVVRPAESCSLHISIDTGLPSGTALCPSESLTVSVTAVGAHGLVNYSWEPAHVFSDPFAAHTVAHLATSTLLSVVAQDDSGCSDYAEIFVPVKAFSRIGADTFDICRGETANVSFAFENTAEPITFAAHPPAGVRFTGETASLSPNSSTSYEITATDHEGCMFVDSIFVHVDTFETTLAIESCCDTTIPAGGIAYLHTNIVEHAGETRIIWAPALWIDFAESSYVQVSPPFTTTYIVTATDSGRCGMKTRADTLTVFVETEYPCTLDYIASFSDTTVCAGASLNLLTHATGESPYTSYFWTPVDFLFSATTENPAVSTITRSITYRGYALDGYCRDSVMITVHVPQFAPVGGSEFSACAGETLSLEVACSDCGSDFEIHWEPIELLDVTDITRARHVVSADTSLLAIFTSATHTCTETLLFTIDAQFVNNSATAIITASHTTIYDGDSIWLSAYLSPTYGIAHILWRGDNVRDTTGFGTWAIPETSGFYFATISDSQTCGVAIFAESVFVEVLHAPCSLTVIAHYDDSICIYDSTMVTVSVTASSGTYNLLWRPETCFTAITDTGAIFRAQHTSVCTVTAIDSAGCIGNTMVFITVIPSPIATIIAPDTVFVGDTITLFASPNDTSYTYVWNGPADFSAHGARVENYFASTSQNGWYKLTVANTFGCMRLDSAFITCLPTQLMPIYAHPAAMIFSCFQDSTCNTQQLVMQNFNAIPVAIDSHYFTQHNVFFAVMPDAPQINAHDSLIIEIGCQTEAIGVFIDTLAIQFSLTSLTQMKTPMLANILATANASIDVFPNPLICSDFHAGDCLIDSTRVHNFGTAPLIIDDIFPSNTLTTRILEPALPCTIATNEWRYIAFELCSQLIGQLTDTLHIISNAANMPHALVEIRATIIADADFTVKSNVVTPNNDNIQDIIEFGIPDGHTPWQIEIFDALGKRLCNLARESWDCRIDGQLVPPGTYYFKLVSNKKTLFSGSFAIVY